MGLHIFFLPFLAPGHMIPMVDLAKLFASRGGVKATIITTAANASRVQPALNRSPLPIGLITLPFPHSVPENVTSLPTPDLTPEFIAGLDSLEAPFERLMIEHRPDCIVSDIFYPWSADAAGRQDIPRVVFHGSSNFNFAVISAISKHKPHETVAEDEPFVVPGLPHAVRLVRSQLMGGVTSPGGFEGRMMESLKCTYGSIMNTFHMMEPGYTDNNHFFRRTWLVGPVSLCNSDTPDRAVRGGGGACEFGSCLDWLDSKEPGSVLYICFGSLGEFTVSQLGEIATGLISSGCQFIWVVRNVVGDSSDWMPQGFEERGLIVRGWAPQMVILNHQAVGGFMTHCGWNSCLEGASAGVPMITWPLFADQFCNERLLVDVLRIGVAVGSKVNSAVAEKRTIVSGEEVKKAQQEVMGSSEEAQARRKRAKEVAQMARIAVEEGGSSYKDLCSMVHELTEIKNGKAEAGIVM